jgi:cysteine desulfurase
LAIKGVFERYQGQQQHYITCQTEHKAVLDAFAQLEQEGAEVTYLPVNSVGEIDLNELEAQVRDYTKMICLMW